MSRLDGTTRRAIVAHAIGALAVALPWPLLLVLVAANTDNPWLLGLAGSARMLPYVAISWLTARLADAMRRDLIVRATLLARGVLLTATALAVVAERPWVAVVCCTLAVAIATPAYPAMVAAMPGIAGARRRSATDLLVTVEVGAFVVGAAVGGLLLGSATRDVLPWVPVAMTVVALVLILPVTMPAPRRRQGRDRRPSAYAALRRAPSAWRAIAVMAAVNLGISLVALALLPMALDSWSSDAAGYGLATGVLGFAALGAPLLRRIGATPVVSMRRGLFLVALGVLLVVPAPSIGWALVPLALAGAAAVSVEAAATSVLQEEVSDEVRASVFGLNDSVIVAAALVGSLLAPVSVEVVGGGPALTVTAVGLALAAWWARASAATPSVRLPSVVSEKETDDDAQTPDGVPKRGGPPHVPAQRTPADRLLDVDSRGHAAERIR
ncbi:MFS transporter [Marmoricola sp. URHB0036]|uniref:MFS transporter n=1 Tax=Marmoricola sp. URHB0036 TaxID=1298863 RepID=UPI00040877DF|nr:MFS transporter [Marmoricola sp. URHB0036]